jgi:hypothetical protein
VKTSVRDNLPQAIDLERDLIAAGYRHGIPPTMHAEAYAIDRVCYSKLRCPRCARRTMQLRPFHCDRRYVLVCACWNCGCGVEC